MNFLHKRILIFLISLFGMGVFCTNLVASEPAQASFENSQDKQKLSKNIIKQGTAPAEENPESVASAEPAATSSDPDKADEWIEENEDDESPTYVPKEVQEDGVMVPEQMSPEAKTEKAQMTQEFDIEGRKNKVANLVDRGINYFKKNTIEKACHDFTQTKKFIDGELYLFVFDYTGICMAHGQQADLVWKNLINLKDTFGSYFVQDFVKAAKAGGGWVTYQWRGATKITYVKPVAKGDKTYLIGCGFYPHSKADAVISLVKGAVSIFNETVKRNASVDEAFSVMSYPLGKFVYGDLYIYALDFDGVIHAQGDVPALIGTNSLEYTDSKGKKANKEIIAKLKKTDQGVWVDYTSKNAKKLAYAEKVQDAKGNNYFIACGYYPDANRNATQDLVRKGYAYMKKHGETAAAQEFTGETKMQFRYGDLYLFVYDMKGNCIAHGGNETYVGQNHWDREDQDGHKYVQEYIQKAQTIGYGWVDAKLKNSFQSAYVEKVELGLKSYVIGSSLYPISKNETMVLLAKSGASYLAANSREKAFNAFSIKDSAFVRGDLSVMTFDADGICYAYGDNADMIWRNMFDAKDDEGRPWVKLMINKVKKGAGTIVYKLNGADVIAHCEPVTKAGKKYVVASSYYR